MLMGFNSRTEHPNDVTIYVNVEEVTGVRFHNGDTYIDTLAGYSYCVRGDFKEIVKRIAEYKGIDR